MATSRGRASFPTSHTAGVGEITGAGGAVATRGALREVVRHARAATASQVSSRAKQRRPSPAGLAFGRRCKRCWSAPCHTPYRDCPLALRRSTRQIPGNREQPSHCVAHVSESVSAKGIGPAFVLVGTPAVPCFVTGRRGRGTAGYAVLAISRGTASARRPRRQAAPTVQNAPSSHVTPSLFDHPSGFRPRTRTSAGVYRDRWCPAAPMHAPSIGADQGVYLFAHSELPASPPSHRHRGNGAHDCSSPLHRQLPSLSQSPLPSPSSRSGSARRPGALRRGFQTPCRLRSSSHQTSEELSPPSPPPEAVPLTNSRCLPSHATQPNGEPPPHPQATAHAYSIASPCPYSAARGAVRERTPQAPNVPAPVRKGPSRLPGQALDESGCGSLLATSARPGTPAAGPPSGLAVHASRQRRHRLLAGAASSGPPRPRFRPPPGSLERHPSHRLGLYGFSPTDTVEAADGAGESALNPRQCIDTNPA